MPLTDDIRARLLSALTGDGRPSSDFDLNADVSLPEGRKLRPAAVLIAVTETGDVILTKRSARLKHHPGQIAFPGGKMDDGDASPVDCALREAFEEVALPPDTVEVLGTLPEHETVTGFCLTPVVGLVHGDPRLVPETGEVAEVFTAPLDFVTNPARFVVEGRRWEGRLRRYYAVPYGPYYIWGATARILRGLADRMVR